MSSAVERRVGAARATRIRVLLAVVGFALAAAPLSVARSAPVSGERSEAVTAGATGPVQVTAGGEHSCAIQVDLTITCWGSDSDGQTTPPPGTFTAIDAGGLHTCAIRTDATVACWGKNDDGESTPPPGTFSAISAGGDHSCGLRTDNTLACWGRNTQSPPFNVAPGGSHISMSAGNTAGTTWSCAVKDKGALACWGYNSYGRGNPPPGQFSAVSTGATHGCALRFDTAIECWGGISSNGAPLPAPPAGRFTAISNGYDFACGLRNDQTLSCFGDDAAGRATPPAGTFVALSAGYSHGCAVRTNGAVACWGSNSSGQVSQIPPGLTSPVGEVAPGALAFAAQERGTISASRTVTVTNRGAADLQVVGESFSGPAADDFLIGASTCRGPLPGGQSCTVWVRFAPQGDGDRAATLTLATNATPAAYAVAITGTVSHSETPPPPGPGAPAATVVPPLTDVPPAPESSCTVPKLAGRTLPAAKTAIAKAGCTLGSVRKAFSATVKRGRVVKSSPAAGKVLAEGATVKLVVSRGKRG